MYLVQALYWLHDILANKEESSKITKTIEGLQYDTENSQKLLDDLFLGLSAMPIWMQETLLKAQQKDVI
jgi:hypothetical protein